MNVGKSYRLLEFVFWSRRKLYVLIALSVLPVLLIEFAGWPGAAVPWTAIAVLGTAASFIVGFKNAQTYGRAMEAQQVWAAIAVSSRYWGLICRDFPAVAGQARPLLYRHLAWLTALRYRLREPQPWETARQARAERIKYFPYPRQYAIINAIFVWSFAALLPFGLAGEFTRLAANAVTVPAAWVTCLTIPFSVLITWLYVALDQVGQSTENPFEGSANDVPIAQISMSLEAELRAMSGEPQVVPLPRSAGPIVV